MIEDDGVAAPRGGITRVRGTILSGARDYANVIVGVGLTRLLTFLAAVLLARSLSIASFGAYSFAYTVMTLVAQLPGVLDSSFVRNYAFETDDDSRRALLAAHVFIKICLLSLIAVLTVVWAQPLSTAVFHKPGLKTLLIAALLGGACFSTFSTVLAFHQARKKFLAYSATFLLINLVAFAALGVYLSLSRATPLGAMLTFNTFPYAVAAIAAVLWLVAQSAGRPGRDGRVTELLRFSGWLIPSAPLYILLQRVDLLVLSALAAYRVLGLYGAAVTLSSVASLFTSQLQVVFLPKAAECISSPEGRRDFFIQAMATSASIVLVALAGIAFSPWLLRVAFGPQYAAAAQPLRLLLLGYAISATVIPLWSLLYAVGKTRVIFGERVLELLAATGFCLFLVPRYAASGAAAGMALASVFGAVYLVANVKRALTELSHSERSLGGRV